MLVGFCYFFLNNSFRVWYVDIDGCLVLLFALGCARMRLSRRDDELLLCTLVKSVRIDLRSRGYGCNSVFELHVDDAGRRLCS